MSSFPSEISFKKRYGLRHRSKESQNDERVRVAPLASGNEKRNYCTVAELNSGRLKRRFKPFDDGG